MLKNSRTTIVKNPDLSSQRETGSCCSPAERHAGVQHVLLGCDNVNVVDECKMTFRRPQPTLDGTQCLVLTQRVELRYRGTSLAALSSLDLLRSPTELLPWLILGEPPQPGDVLMALQKRVVNVQRSSLTALLQRHGHVEVLRENTKIQNEEETSFPGGHLGEAPVSGRRFTRSERAN